MNGISPMLMRNRCRRYRDDIACVGNSSEQSLSDEFDGTLLCILRAVLKQPPTNSSSICKK
jgi:hypothetical protein